MRNAFLLITLLVFPGLLTARAGGEHKIEFGDPFIMLYDGVYYSYGTSVAGSGFEVFISDDLHTWRRPEGVEDNLVLRRDDVWGDDNFWAPEVYYVNGRFYMFYTADERTCVAVADSPLGPFRGDTGPYLPDEKNIDNSLFLDDDGKAYLLVVRFNDGLNVWAADLSDDLMSIEEHTLTKCIAVSQDWETDRGRVNEGPFITKHKGKYYMTYSGNDYRSRFYGIGFAVADSLHGEWTKYEGNPIYQNAGVLTGIGHSAMFRDKKGKLRIVFHAHKDRDSVHPRAMHISTVKFKNIGGEPVMAIGPEYITPVLTD